MAGMATSGGLELSCFIVHPKGEALLL